MSSILTAHGGLAVWSRLSYIDMKFDFTGATLAIKSQPQHLIPSARIFTKQQKVVYTNLGGAPSESWIFHPSRVWKEDASGIILASRSKPREAFKDHALETPWDDLHLLCFCGYAMWQYFNFPFLLSRADVFFRELELHREGSQSWRVLEVTYPSQEALATHAAVQTYYFNDRFSLQRHDYAPEVLAGNPATQFVFDTVDVKGLKFPTPRRVVAKDENGPMTFGPIPTLILLMILRIELIVEAGDEDVGGEPIWERSELCY